MSSRPGDERPQQQRPRGDDAGADESDGAVGVVVAASARHGDGGDDGDVAPYCDVYIHGVAGPLHIALPGDTTHTMVRQLRALVLNALPSPAASGTATLHTREQPVAGDGDSIAGASRSHAASGRAATTSQQQQQQQRYVRLMFRGKELRADEQTLSQYGVQSGSALHALVTTVQPRYQRQRAHAAAPTSLTSLSTQNMHDAREAIANALHAIWPTTAPAQALDPAGSVAPATSTTNVAATTTTSAAAAATAATDEAALRTSAESAQRLRLLHAERLLRSQTEHAPSHTTRAAADAAAVADPAVATTATGGRVRVMQLTTAPVAAATAAGGGGGGPSPPVVLADEVDEAAFMAEQLRRLRVFAIAFVAGFVLGPLCFVLPTSMFATAGLLVGCCANVLCCWVIYSDTIMSW